MTFADNWKKAGEPVDEFDPDDGHYSIRIVDGGAFTGNDGRQWAKLELQVTAGEHEGRSFVDFMNLNNDVGLRIARQNLSLYGINADEVQDLEELDTAMLELRDTQADVTVKHSGNGFLNVTVNRAMTGPPDIPTDGQESFEVDGGKQPAKTGARYGQDPEEEIPF